MQQWAEVETEDGTSERTHTQRAQTWPLADHVKLENIESAIQILTQACDFLYNAVSQVRSAADQKMDTVKARQAIGEISLSDSKDASLSGGWVEKECGVIFQNL